MIQLQPEVWAAIAGAFAALAGALYVLWKYIVKMNKEGREDKHLLATTVANNTSALVAFKKELKERRPTTNRRRK